MASRDVVDTVKLKTVIYISLGLIFPLCPVTLPIFFYLAYRSYRSGGPPPISLYQLQKAKNLLDSGGIDQEEYDTIKARAKDLNG